MAEEITPVKYLKLSDQKDHPIHDTDCRTKTNEILKTLKSTVTVAADETTNILTITTSDLSTSLVDSLLD